MPGFGYATFQPPVLYDGAFYFEIMSETAKFTPGPWRVDPAFPDDIQSENAELEISRTVRKENGGRQSIIPKNAPPASEANANARLIAAAPDLYEALQEAKLQIEYLHGKFTATGTGNAVLSKIEAALEKADGKTETI